MTLFRRVNDILTANLNDLVDRFEDPEKLLRQALREMDDAIAASTSAAARSIAAKKMLDAEIGTRQAQTARWQRNAAAAVAAGDDGRARRALSRRREQERLVAALEEQSAAAEMTIARLRRRMETMRVKRADAGQMLIELAARQSVVQAHRRLGEGYFCDASNSVVYRFERLRKRVEVAAAEAEALLELAGDDELSTDHDDEETVAIEMELVELKQGHTRE
jgi:phage shock protein A